MKLLKKIEFYCLTFDSQLSKNYITRLLGGFKDNFIWIIILKKNPFAASGNIPLVANGIFFNCQQPEGTYFSTTTRFENRCFLTTDEEKLCFTLGGEKKISFGCGYRNFACCKWIFFGVYEFKKLC